MVNLDSYHWSLPKSICIHLLQNREKKNNLAKDTGSKTQTVMQRKITFKQPVMWICTEKRTTMYPHFSYPPVSNEILHLRPFCPKGVCYHHPFNVGWIQVGEKGAIRKVLHFLICWATAPPLTSKRVQAKRGPYVHIVRAYTWKCKAFIFYILIQSSFCSMPLASLACEILKLLFVISSFWRLLHCGWGGVLLGRSKAGRGPNIYSQRCIELYARTF